jgi:hypothetical protein
MVQNLVFDYRDIKQAEFNRYEKSEENIGKERKEVTGGWRI